MFCLNKPIQITHFRLDPSRKVTQDARQLSIGCAPTLLVEQQRREIACAHTPTFVGRAGDTVRPRAEAIKIDPQEMSLSEIGSFAGELNESDRRRATADAIGAT